MATSADVAADEHSFFHCSSFLDQHLTLTCDQQFEKQVHRVTYIDNNNCYRDKQCRNRSSYVTAVPMIAPPRQAFSPHDSRNAPPVTANTTIYHLFLIYILYYYKLAPPAAVVLIKSSLSLYTANMMLTALIKSFN